MFYNEYINVNKEIQSKLLDFLDNENSIEENYQILIDMLTKYKVLENQNELKSFLYLISNIGNNHHRIPCFYNKIEQILCFLGESIKKNFTNSRIFHIFHKNKAILLILFEQKLLFIDEFIFKKIGSLKYVKRNYHKFFQPEILMFIEKIGSQNAKDLIKQINNEFFSYCDPYNRHYYQSNYIRDRNDFYNFITNIPKSVPENFYEKRKIGENDNLICQLIREDLIKDFIIYVSKNDYPLDSNIEKSIYETNLLLDKEYVRLIEYAAFFGSIQIFKYLHLNEVNLTQSLWIYGIHSDNSELISILEDEKIQPKNPKICFKEAIKCHHNDVANYIQSNLLEDKLEFNDNEHNINDNILSYCFLYYNYLYFPDELNNFVFSCACKSDNFSIINYFLTTKKAELNDKTIHD